MIEKHIPKTETRFDDLVGVASLNFNNNTEFEQFAQRIAGIDITAYQPISARFFIIEQETIVTIYGLDIKKHQEHFARTGKIPVKIYKVETSLEELFKYIKQIDFTLVSGQYEVEDFEVIN
ncbi:MAG TPA: hypothetical protein VIK89_15265 [Cytophagaceae bacterium]